MNDQLIEIGARLRALREDCELSAHTMAGKLGVSLEEYEEYERGENDFSFSFLYNAAQVLGVDVLDIMSGDTPKLKTACLVRAGEGYTVNRREAYEYKHLAYTFKDMLDRYIIIRDSVNMDVFMNGATPESLWDPNFDESLASESSVESADIFATAMENCFKVGSVVIDAILDGSL